MNELDELVESHVKRFIQKVEARIQLAEDTIEVKEPKFSFIKVTPTVEFLSELEWNLIKLQLGTKSDADVIAYIETHPYFKEVLVPKFGEFTPELYPTDRRVDMFCVINLSFSA